MTVKMPARTPPSKLSLTGIAKKPGRLVITGCYIQMFGVTWHQPWQEKGNPGAAESLHCVLLPSASPSPEVEGSQRFFASISLVLDCPLPPLLFPFFVGAARLSRPLR